MAIFNRRILFVADAVVRFRYRDYADHPPAPWLRRAGSRSEEMTLPATEFLRRFLLHVVPRGFMRIRHHGITTNCRRREKLTCCRHLLGQAQPDPSFEPGALTPQRDDDGTAARDSDPPRCPSCGAPMLVVEIIPPIAAPYDTS